MKTIKIKISGMHCDSCVKVVSLDLKELAGMEKAEVSWGEAKVDFDEKMTNQEAILETIKNAGYQGELTA